MKRLGVLITIILFGVLVGSRLLATPAPVEAGNYDANAPVQYKEYWVSHDQFTGGCDEDFVPWGTNYLEPSTGCPKDMQITILDNFANALKVEIYLDLWRNYDSHSAFFTINGGQTVYTPDVGYDYSRTPWIEEIPINALAPGLNIFSFGGTSPYHIHDMSIRIYHDDANPLLPAPGPDPNDLEPPDGKLLHLVADDPNTEIPIDTGGILKVNGDKVKLTAEVYGEGTDYVEFHAFYDGYDDDNDGDFTDWHNVNRNNWCPGGKEEATNGCTINHIGTINTNSNQMTQTVSITWDLPHVINQPGVRFKIRVVDLEGNVRDAAGGISPEYTLARDYPVIYYTMPNFDDFGLHMGGNRPDEVHYNFPLPDNLNMALYSKVYLLGMYWRTPRLSVNGSTPQPAQPAGNDQWELATKEVAKNLIKPGINKISYYYNAGFGQFVEHPGPMIVLRGNFTVLPDTGLPFVASRNPVAGALDVDAFSAVSVNIADAASGVDKSSIIMTVNGGQVTPTFSGPSNNLTVTYQPTERFPYDSEIPVTIFACDLVGNCMLSADVYSFFTEPTDLAPPVISDIVVNTTDTTATISWKTDEPADGKVDYGETLSYELGSESDTALLLTRTIELTNLTADTEYNFMLTSADYDGNTASTVNLKLHTKRGPGSVVSDDFSDCKLDTRVWTYINPLGDTPLGLTGTAAQMPVPGGSTHNIWQGAMDAPRLMQDIVNEDFEVEAKFESGVTLRTQMQGILVQESTLENFRVTFQHDGSGPFLVVADMDNGKSTALVNDPISGTVPNYMRLTRISNVWNVQLSGNGQNWIPAATFTRTLTTNQIGVFVGNSAGNPAHTGIVDYFFNTSAPITPEDPPLLLNVQIDGIGTVNRDPDKAVYNCNDNVELTAVPAPDWEFVQWGGALSGSSPTGNVIMTGTRSVIAQFENNNLYTLNVDTVHDGNGIGGVITWEPDEASYPYGTEVDLTATPTPGWSFLGYTGDFTGTLEAETLVIEKNTSITGTFQEDHYTLTTAVINEGVGVGGDITVDPVQPDYLYGDEVTLTANTEPGWTFTGWEGDITGTNPSITFTMTQNIVAFAKFTQSQYDLTVNIVSNGDGDGGLVIKEPDQPTYGYGQDVVLTAIPENGWTFGGWSGDLVSTNISDTVNITGDTAVTATFDQQQYTVDVTTVGNGSVEMEPDKPFYVYGDIITLTAVAAPFYEFLNWSGDIAGTSNPTVLAIDKDYDVTATFDIDLTPIEILSHDIQVLPGGTLARVTWVTDVPGDSRVDYGETAFYETGTVTDDPLVVNHELILTGLTPETFYHYQITSEDTHGNSVSTEDLTFSTSASSGIFSDDFSACALDDRWTFVDPLDDATFNMAGRHIEINVPAGTAHNVFPDGSDNPNKGPRIMQPANDTDFELIVKFDSELIGKRVVNQGLIIEQDNKTFIRLDFYNRSDETTKELNVYAATFTNLSVNAVANKRVADPGGPMWMRIVRTGDDWEQLYSFDGENWTRNVKFTYEMSVKRVGVFAGNSSFAGSIPAHTAVVDYFFNSAAPIDPQDQRYPLNIDIQGVGQVTTNPDQDGFHCGQEVTLTAVPGPGWQFFGWQGDITGQSAVRTVNVTGEMDITAMFSQGGASPFRALLPLIVKP